MIKSKLIKSMALGLMVLSIMSFHPMKANAEWKSDSNGKWYSEGNSYTKGWKCINGKWYYFDNKTGYMKCDEIVDGYYVNSYGVYIENPSEEIQKFAKIIKSNDWYDRITNGMRWYSSFEGSNSYNEINAPLRGFIKDMNGDGINEMIVTNNSQNSVRVVTYKNGKIEVLSNIKGEYPQYYGYNKSTNELIIYNYLCGTEKLYGYKLTEDNNLIETFFYFDCANDTAGMTNKGYYISKEDYDEHKTVSKQEYMNKLNELKENADTEGKIKISEMLAS